MGSVLPLIIFAVITSFWVIETAVTNNTAMQKDIAHQWVRNDAVQFVTYRSAVETYMKLNPAFIGTVPAATLIAQGNQFSPAFIAKVNNSVTAIGAANGRVITCFGNLQPGSVGEVLRYTDNDASIGIANGGTWLSYAQNTNQVAQALAVGVADGDVVSVVQIGN